MLHQTEDQELISAYSLLCARTIFTLHASVFGQLHIFEQIWRSLRLETKISVLRTTAASVVSHYSIHYTYKV